MAARHPARDCAHGDASTPYPVWADAGWPAGEDPELDDALAELSAALMACPEPLQGSLLELAAQDVRRGLSATPVQHRQAVLRPLGLPLSPRTIGQQLCKDVLVRLNRVDDHAARHSATALTRAMLKDFHPHMYPEEFAERLPGVPARDPAEVWSPALARVAVWSQGLASVRDARLWRWATTQPWFVPEGVEATHVAAIAAAAERVIAASAEFRFFLPAAPLKTAAPVTDSAPPADATLQQQPAPQTDLVEETPRMSATPDTRTSDPVGDFEPGTAGFRRVRQAEQALQQALGEALPAARRVLADVTADQPPVAADLDVLATARTAFDEAVAVLAAAGSAAAPSTGAGVRAALDDLVADASDAPVRDRLVQLGALCAPEGNEALSTMLATAQERAADLVAVARWSAAQRNSAVTLATLGDLADPDTAPEQAIALQQQLVAAHSDLALLAVTAGQLIQSGLAPASSTAPAAPATDQAGNGIETVDTSSLEITPTEPPAVGHGLADVPATVEDRTATPAATPTPADPAADPALAASAHVGSAPAAGMIPVAPAVAVSDEIAAHARLVDGVADLIRSRRFGLAEAVASAADWAEGPRAALRLAALADAVRSETGPVGAALRGEVADVDIAAIAEDTPSVLLTVAAMVRAALVTGEPSTGAVLTELAGRVEPNLAAIAEQVGSRALQGALVSAPPLTVLADVTEVERSLRALAEGARTLLRPRTLRFKRATDIAKLWMAADGILGRPLTLAAADDRDAVDEVVSAIRRLSDSSTITREIDDLDRRFRGVSGRPIEGAGRQDLVTLAAETVQALAAWADAVLSLKRSSTAQTWSTSVIAEMRQAVLACRAQVLAALHTQAGHSDPLLAAAAAAAAQSLTLTFAVLDGEQSLPAGEPTPGLALSVELLKVPGASAGTGMAQVRLPVGITTVDLLAAADRSWAEAVTVQVAAENFDAARLLLTMAAAHQLPGGGDMGDDLADQVTAAQEQVAADLTDIRAQLAAELRRARTNNEVSEEQVGELTGMLRDAEVTGSGDLAAVRVRLARVAELLPHYREEAARRLSERLAAMATVNPATAQRVTGLIGDGELSTAEELIYHLEIGQEVPQVSERPDLMRFFPSVPDALPDGLTNEVIAAIRSRGVVPGCEVLDYTRLGSDLADLAATALDGWRRWSAAAPADRQRVSERDVLLSALRVVGIEGRGIRQLDLPRGRDRRFVDVAEVTINGKALVPAFGSKLDGRLRVLLAWGQPSAELLLSHADQDNADSSLLIVHFGTMSAQTRRELAERAVAGTRTAPVVVLDDAALAYLVAHGDRQMDATMSVLLPFSNTNPYVSQKRGLVAEEMFYGRDAERKSVLDADGTQLIYGGRGLGKSALLRSAGAMFESQGAPGERIGLYLSLDTLGIGAGSAIGPDAIWHGLQRDLTKLTVLTPPRRAAVASGKKAHEEVRAGVLAWMDADARRRLLILLDESDRFFEADAPAFLETNRLKDLGLATDGRIKVVFAGLHSVQRYAKTARNGPFSHLAQRPTVIGPLRPQSAANLLTRPLHALGYRFADDDLVNRVLGYCSYQPFLLQMFARRLVTAMHAERGEPGGLEVAEPPYVITRDDVVAVEQDAELKASISAAFHDTLHLDPRYNVIANVLAHHAHESGIDARLSDVELRDECLAWWPVGFEPLDVEGFRAYLQEMVGLGVLARNTDGRGWHLRSPNVLTMIGTKDDVITQLVGAATSSVPDEFIALESRLELPDGRRSPLTAGQSDDVLGDHANQVRVVLGSEATGIGDVATAIRCVADVGDRFTVPAIASRRQFEEALVAGLPGQRRVVLTDLHARGPKDGACLDALTAALDLRPAQRGVTRSAVLVAGPEQLGLWRRVLADGGRTPSLGTVTLRRYDAQTLRVWTLDAQKFSAPERLDRLLEVTGGWPMLVERAGQLVSDGADEARVLDMIAAEVASPAGAAALVEAVGVTADPDLDKAFASVLSLVDAAGVSRTDLVVAVEMAVGDAETVVACLQALGVFDVDEDGMYRPEPLLVRSWPHRA
ncbi:hypothetical protein ABC795_04625 [Blastococcus sp. HT6-30]|uniref:hypothetical protein n=1 Tax=Blastococcus sp. HT6-30 TaxID=3144843 RepID=UPI00321B34E8